MLPLSFAAAVCRRIMQRKKIYDWKFLRIDMLKDTNGLHIEDSQSISSTRQYFKDEIIMDEKRNHDTDAIQMDIAFQNKELKQYQVRIHPDTGESGRIDTVLQ